MKSYELDSARPEIPLNKTAGRFYFEKLMQNLNTDKNDIRLLFGESLSNDEKKELFKKFVCIINLETNAYCNRVCHYCPLSVFDRKSKEHKQKIINDALLSKILDELESIKYSSTICLNLYNEPLSDTKILDRIKDIKARLPKTFIRFNSNGDFVNMDILKNLESSGLDSINITLHTIKINSYSDDWAKDSLDRFYSKLSLKSPEYEIIANQSIASSFQYKNLNVLVNTSNWDLYGNDRGGAVSDLSIENRTNPCVKVFREFTIDYRGRVFPCCNIFPDDINNEKYIFGNLNNESIFDIFSSKIWAKWRKSLFITSPKPSPCNTCNDGYFTPTSKDCDKKRLEILNHIKQKDKK